MTQGELLVLLKWLRLEILDIQVRAKDAEGKLDTAIGHLEKDILAVNSFNAS